MNFQEFLSDDENEMSQAFRLGHRRTRRHAPATDSRMKGAGWLGDCWGRYKQSVSGFEAVLVNSETLDLRIECSSGDAEFGGCARRAGNSSVTSSQCRFDYVSFLLVQSAVERRVSLGQFQFFVLKPGLINGETVRVAQDDRPFNDVLQLADVAWPLILL